MALAASLSALNPAQRAAVTAPPGHYLILAGAGSGKTRVLTQRIAYLIDEHGIWAHSVLAVTFTNKAAAEMRQRVEQLLGQPAKGMWIGTFHGLAHRLLRLHHDEAGLPEGFSILDADDQQRLIKRCIAELGLDEKQYTARFGQWLINGFKDEGLRAAQVPTSGRGAVEAAWLQVYRAYEAACARLGVVDFAELLLRSDELLARHPALLEHYQNRFSHLLVDEFQDTNRVQYQWVRRLAGARAEVFVVGDDDQSIYSWRGARVENMQHFLSDFPGATTLRLEQNYRSTGHILEAANALIAHNSARLGKRLWTEDGAGEPIQVYAALDEREEARYVVEQIQRWRDAGGALGDCAVLYRSNAQSRLFEDELMRRGLAYRVYGGLRFFERAEVKDALAWLRLIARPEDDAALERALSAPPRGVGERSLDELRQHARGAGLSLYAAIEDAVRARRLRGKPLTGLSTFLELYARLAALRAAALAAQVEAVLDWTGLRAHYARDDRLGTEGRVENLDELVNVAAGFTYDPEARGRGSSELDAFLAYAALEAGEGQSPAWADAVQLMTLHAAKGLEFPWVALTGLEEGLFPIKRAIDEGGEALAEERRLAYVGITRARRRLLLSHAESRRRHGEAQFNRPSRFLAELPEHVLQHVRPRPGAVLRPNRLHGAAPLDRPGIALGARVHHALFGEGIVIGVEGSGEHARVRVNFERHGPKVLVYAYAKLTML